MRIKTTVVAALALGALLLPLAPGAEAAESAPAWSLTVTSFPTNFAPGSVAHPLGGPGYLLVARNVGGAATTSAFTLTDTVPDDFELSPLSPSGYYGGGQGAHSLSCEASGQTITCHGSEPLYPGQQAGVDIPLKVPAASPSGSITDEATVEGGGATPVSASTATVVSPTPAPFGFLDGHGGAYGSATNADGSTATQAGSHPYQLTVSLEAKDFAPNGEEGESLRVSGGGLRDISGELPQGMVVNPAAVSTCNEATLETQGAPCPVASQVGIIRTNVSLSGRPGAFLSPLYNMQPPPGTVSDFGYEVIEGVYIHLLGRVRSGSDYGLSADVNNIPAQVGVLGAEVTLWGSPTDKSHDQVRGRCVVEEGACTSERLDTALLALPSSCSEEPLETVFKIKNWIGEAAQASYPSTDLNGTSTGIDGCNSLEFEPTIEARPTTNLADSPTGLEFHLKQRQELKVDGRFTANLKNTTVTLPAGMALNPSAGNGLAACSEAQLGSDGATPANCPNASKIGSVEVTTPLLENRLQGAVYLATPFQNPFGSQLAIYIAVEDPLTGVVAKLPGKVTADPSTGQLTTSVQESPELPLEDVAIKFFNGPRAALTTPPACGTYATTSDLTPWSTPEGADAHPGDTFQTSASPTGGSCATSEAEMPSHPSFSAGTISPQAGAYSPFVLHLSREDGTQRIAGIDTTLPEGLIGKLAGVAECPESAIAGAKAREAPNQGATEQAHPSCPASSEVGTADIAAGSGITPIHVGAHAYLAGPYKGAPISIVVITPAVAGPFDLGTVVSRVALDVDPETARIHALSDPLPQILDGIPLDLRSINLELGRPSFTLNPTSCNPSSVLGSATSALGGSAALSSPFQVGGCSTLPFKPNLAISIKGATKRGGHPALKAVATAKPGEANIGRVSVALPPTEFLDQGNIKTICTKVQFAANACPAASIYGKATAITPLLDSPLSGPVYLRSSTHKLPDLVVALKGPASQPIEVVLAGKVDTFHKGLRNTFEAVPDAPVSKFTLEMQGGPKKGLIENSADICKASDKATVLMDGQNGKAHDFEAVLKTSCGGKGRKGGKKGSHKG